MTPEYAAPASVNWATSTTGTAAARERFQPSSSALKTTYIGCGVALAIGLIMGVVLRPDYAAGDGAAGPRLVVAGAPAASGSAPTP